MKYNFTKYGSVVIEALNYKPEVRGIDPMRSLNFINLPNSSATLSPGAYSANRYEKYFGGGGGGLSAAE
jgi:hypothetical protein